MTLALVSLGALLPATEAGGQSDFVASRLESHLLFSGELDNPSAEPTVVFRETVDFGAQTPWLRLYLAEAVLPGASVLRVSSLEDGEVQSLDREALRRWSFATAFFNGGAVLVELVAGPDTRGNMVLIEKIRVGERQQREPFKEAICGLFDTRVTAADAAVGRLVIDAAALPEPLAICTAFIIDNPTSTPERCHLTAGHCFGGLRPTVLQFSVPLSDADCAINQPPVDKQFPLRLGSLSFEDAGSGSDWGVFRTAPNDAGETTFSEQGAAYTVATTTPDAGSVRVTGYGRDRGGGPFACRVCSAGTTTGQSHNTLQTASGDIADLSGDFLEHDVDTCRASSGSPVILESSNEVVAIHTHGGCGLLFGDNGGTATTQNDLDAAITACEAAITGSR